MAIDATPLIGRRTGIGRYVGHLVRAIADHHPDVHLILTGVTVRGRSQLPRDPAWRVVARPFPARLAHCGWQRSTFPPAELLAGPHDLFHGTNFVLPPSRRAPGVVTIHDLAWLLLPDTVAAATHVLNDLVPRALRRASHVLVPSHAVAEAVQERLGVPENRIRVTPLGVDDEWFDARPDPDIARRLALPERYVVAVATHEPRKNLQMLVKAHRQAVETDRSIPHLVLVGAAGWGPTWSAPHPEVLCTGYLDDQQVKAVVAGAQALAMPSLDEGFGLPLLEAFAAGVPVIASDLAALREVSGGLALAVSPDDLDAWVHHLADPPSEEAAKLRSWAREWTWERCAGLTVGAYREAAQRLS